MISQVRPVPISQGETVVIWCVATKKFASEDSFEFLCLSSAAVAVQVVMK